MRPALAVRGRPVRTCTGLVFLELLLFFPWCPSTGEATAAEPPDRVARLVRDLGAQDFERRESAANQLMSLGVKSRAELTAALGSPDAEVRLQAARLLEQLELEACWAGSRVTIDARQAFASELLAALGAESGNRIHAGDAYGNFADSILDLHMTDVPFWEALDEICRRSGNTVRPQLDAQRSGFVATSGAANHCPCAFAGPVRGQITSARRVFTEDLHYAEPRTELLHNFQLQLKFHWEDKFPLAGYATVPRLIEAVTSAGTRVSAAPSSTPTWNTTTPGVREIAATLQLLPVTVRAERLTSLRVGWPLVILGPRSRLEMAPIEEHRRYSQDDLTVTIESIDSEPGVRTKITLSVCRDLASPEPFELAFKEYEFLILDQDGQPFQLQNQTNALGEQGLRIVLQGVGPSDTSEPQSLRVDYPRQRSTRELELVFRDVPLPHRRPE